MSDVSEQHYGILNGVNAHEIPITFVYVHLNKLINAFIYCKIFTPYKCREFRTSLGKTVCYKLK